MSFRSRLFVALILAALVPLAAFAWRVRGEMERRLTAQYEQRLDAMVTIVQDDLAQQAVAVGVRLASLGDALSRDNRFRLAMQGNELERQYRLDYASHAMHMAGLSMLQIQDEAGRILSSGHFRNEYDRLEPDLPRLLAAAPEGTALVPARTPEGPLLALARAYSVAIGPRRLTLVGGVAVEQRFLSRLARDREVAVALIHPGGVVSARERESSLGEPESATVGLEPAKADSASGAEARLGGGASVGAGAAAGSDPGPGPEAGNERVVAEFELPCIAAAPSAGLEVLSARIVLWQSLAELAALRRELDVWFAVVAGATLLLALLVAAALSARIGRPLAELARKTEAVDLERLDVDFASDRRDEIGSLSRLLGAMTARLRASSRRLREAERRAAIGEMARQVNHDIKNGLVPIRNVLRHLAQVAERQPEAVAEVLRERQATLDSGIAYLETLAANYARLTPQLDARPCDVNAIAREATRDASGGAVELRLQLAPGLPAALCDPVAMRRVLENLIANAVESLQSGGGTVTVATAGIAGGVRVVVADTGRGMTSAEAERAFDDFYSTKSGGTGLGLSIVRRLVRDAGGRVRVETTPGAGSRFIVELPAADGGGRVESGADSGVGENGNHSVPGGAEGGGSGAGTAPRRVERRQSERRNGETR